MTTQPTRATDEPSTGWPVAGLFLEALGRRDFAALQDCLDPEVRFRALLPRGPVEAGTATETIAMFRRWFGRQDVCEVVDAAIGRIGNRVYLRWRLLLATAGDPASGEVIEQHAFATGSDRFEVLDLMCSGFHPEHAHAAATPSDIAPANFGPGSA